MKQQKNKILRGGGSLGGQQVTLSQDAALIHLCTALVGTGSGLGCAGLRDPELNTG